MATEHPFTVGQTVVITSVNRGTREGTVTKVGRVLLHVQVRNNTIAFRLENRRINDAYQHSRVWTEDEYAQSLLRREARARLGAAGVRLDHDVVLSPEAMDAISEIVEKELSR